MILTQVELTSIFTTGNAIGCLNLGYVMEDIGLIKWRWRGVTGEAGDEWLLCVGR